VDVLVTSCHGVTRGCCRARGCLAVLPKRALICGSPGSGGSGGCVLRSEGAVGSKIMLPPGFLPRVPLSERAPIADGSSPAAGLCPLRIKRTNPA